MSKEKDYTDEEIRHLMFFQEKFFELIIYRLSTYTKKK